MFSPIGNRKKIILSMLFMVLLIWGVQGNFSYVEAQSDDLAVEDFGVYSSSDLTAPISSIVIGEKFTLSVNVKNNDSSQASTAARVIYYRSIDSTIDTNDHVVGSLSVPIIGRSISRPMRISLTAQLSGTYYYGAEVIYTNDFTPTNNITTGTKLTITGSENLSVSAVSPSHYSVTPQQTFTLTATVKNNGVVSSLPTTLQVYLRSDPTGVFRPVVNAASAVLPIAPTLTSTVSITLQAPPNPGTYYYRVQIGSDSTKISDTSIIVANPVDLSVSTPTVDKSTVAPRETFTLSTTVSNVSAGNFTGPPTTLRYFRSADTTLDRTRDTLLGTDTISSLSGSYGTTSRTSESIRLTAPSEPGTYYYFAYVEPVRDEGYYTYYNDYNYYYPYNYRDTRDNNTSSYVTVTVSAPPDLTVTLHRPRQATFAPGERFTLDATVYNSGTGASAATQLRVYEDSDDYRREQQITSRSVSAISAGSSSSVSIPLTAPTNGGIYYYRVLVDTVTRETKTDNNDSNWIGVDVLEPLVLESLQASKMALRSGESFTLTATVGNDGNTRSAGTTVRYYRSSDNRLSSSDTRVGTSTVSGLAVGGTTQVSISLSAPQAPGTYYYGACVGDSQTYSGDACAVIRLTVLAVVLPESERPPMYWIDTEAGVLQSLTGPDVQRLVPSVQNATGIAVDAAGDKIYWIEKTGNRSGRIRSADLNGRNAVLVAELTSVPMGIAVDAARGKLYITNGWGRVQRFDVDGKNFRGNFVKGLSAPRDIVVDAAGGKLYWTEQPSETTGKIQSANLEGNRNVQTVREFPGVPHGIAVDTASGKLYIANAQGQVQRLNLDGSGFESHLIPNLSAPQGVAIDTAAGKVYWTEAGRVRRANVDGTNRENVVTGLGTPANLSISIAPVEVLIPQSQRPPIYWQTASGLQSLTGATVESFPQAVQNATGIAVDAASDKIYWIEKTGDRSGRIRSADLDGGNVRLVAELTSVPMGIAVDAANGKLYITNGWGRVQRFDVDGSNFRGNFVKGLSAPRGIAIDAAGGKLYWTEQTGERTGKIQSADLKGNVRLVAELTSGFPMGIAVDGANGKLYITNGWGRVQRVDVDGSNFRGDLVEGLSAPQGIAVDAAAGKVYWTARGKIQRANVDGSNIEDVVTGLGGPVGIALNVSAAPNAVAAAPSAAAIGTPNATALLVNYPNPFNPETWIPYQLQKAADVNIAIYDPRGVLVRQLSLGHQVAGHYVSRSRAAFWDGRNQVGEPVASGLYFYTLTAGDFTATRKMLIVK